MNYGLILFFCVFTASNLVYANNPVEKQQLPPYSTEYDPGRDAFEDGRDAIQLAKSTQRHVLIELGGDWCKWCHVMDKFLDDNPDIKAKLHETFVILKINVSDANDNAKFLAAFPKPLGYPHMYIADNNGSILSSKDTAEFLSQGQYSRQRFTEFFEQWKLPHAR
ncbi:MAG TPA: thioredoxin family protein [Gammaproteobacteria bacterium]